MRTHVDISKTVSCPGRSAALLRRCAAEPGPVHQRTVSLSGSRLCAAMRRIAARPGYEGVRTEQRRIRGRHLPVTSACTFALVTKPSHSKTKRLPGAAVRRPSRLTARRF
ncbi:hypothetical protein FXB38_08335 [Bradyrhizobium cytisi]|uniref:Uncharacterized protein n=1 Tax=Bradyrhizobium cytisi TaxID=515489 RepID=A0A5S4X0E1_9BRAD|nr:hypothetical protein FXB38_08335 [Bradyrhizobium cytisi]